MAALSEGGGVGRQGQLGQMQDGVDVVGRLLSASHPHEQQQQQHRAPPPAALEGRQPHPQVHPMPGAAAMGMATNASGALLFPTSPLFAAAAAVAAGSGGCEEGGGGERHGDPALTTHREQAAAVALNAMAFAGGGRASQESVAAAAAAACSNVLRAGQAAVAATATSAPAAAPDLAPTPSLGGNRAHPPPAPAEKTAAEARKEAVEARSGERGILKQTKEVALQHGDALSVTLFVRDSLVLRFEHPTRDLQQAEVRWEHNDKVFVPGDGASVSGSELSVHDMSTSVFGTFKCTVAAVAGKGGEAEGAELTATLTVVKNRTPHKYCPACNARNLGRIEKCAECPHVFAPTRLGRPKTKKRKGSSLTMKNYEGAIFDKMESLKTKYGDSVDVLVLISRKHYNGTLTTIRASNGAAAAFLDTELEYVDNGRRLKMEEVLTNGWSHSIENFYVRKGGRVMTNPRPEKRPRLLDEDGNERPELQRAPPDPERGEQHLRNLFGALIPPDAAEHDPSVERPTPPQASPTAPHNVQPGGLEALRQQQQPQQQQQQALHHPHNMDGMPPPQYAPGHGYGAAAAHQQHATRHQAIPPLRHIPSHPQEEEEEQRLTHVSRASPIVDHLQRGDGHARNQARATLQAQRHDLAASALRFSPRQAARRLAAAAAVAQQRRQPYFVPPARGREVGDPRSGSGAGGGGADGGDGMDVYLPYPHGGPEGGLRQPMVPLLGSPREPGGEHAATGTLPQHAYLAAHQQHLHHRQQQHQQQQQPSVVGDRHHNGYGLLAYAEYDSRLGGLAEHPRLHHGVQGPIQLPEAVGSIARAPPALTDQTR